MEQINYIKHLNAVFIQFSKDSRLNPTHISLYVALFQLWNSYHFPETFHINREEAMRYSKIGSRATYHRCIKELSHWKYVLYMPSHNPYKGSKVKVLKFDTSTEPVLNQHRTSTETSTEHALVPINKHIQTIENNTNNIKLDQPKNENEVIIFFQKENWPELEAKKFYNHYQGIGWRMGGKTKIVDWQATARNWMLKASEIKTEKLVIAVGQNKDNLKISSNKNYNEPL